MQRPLFGDLPRAIMARIDADQGIKGEDQGKFTTPAADTRREPGLLEEQTFPTKFGKPRAALFRARSVFSAESQSSGGQQRQSSATGEPVTPSHANSSAYATVSPPGRRSDGAASRQDDAPQQDKGHPCLCGAPNCKKWLA